MPRRRAFILAIENYNYMKESLASTLPGTHQAAADFRDWLINEQGLAASDIYHCTEDGAIATRTAGANRDDIVDELVRLKNDGKDQTEELYFFYSGHGFCYKDIDGARLADVLLPANYRDRATSGNACLKIDEMQKWLRLCMGPTDHFYFIDACRNDINEKDIKVGTLGLTYDRSKLGIPTVYTLYSTVEGASATVNSGFIGVLLAGLKGKGRAKEWRGDSMAVLFRTVKDYVESNLTGQPVDERKEGSREGIIREIKPPPIFKCQIDVQNAAPSDSFTVAVRTERNQPVTSMTFTGTTGSFHQTPDDYNLSVTTPNFIVDPIDPLPADLYDHRTVHFVKRSPLFGGGAGGGGAMPAVSGEGVAVTIHAPNGAKIILRNLDRGEELDGTATFTKTLARGRYLLKTVDSRGMTVQKQMIDVRGPNAMEVDLSRFEWSPLRDALLSDIHGAHARGAVDLSETLGPTPDQGLDLWLALIGASRIIGGPDDYSKLGPLPLTSFVGTPRNGSPIYLLAGFDEPPKRVAVAFSEGREAKLIDLAPHPHFPGLFESVRRDTGPGYHLVSLKVDEKATMTVGTCTLPNRATLITMSTDARSALRLQQFILPIQHLVSHLPNRVRPFFTDTPLKGVRRMVEIQRQFAESRDLAAILDRRELEDLLYMKWFEPIIALLAAYELARRGETDSLPIVVRNLREHFTELPDTEALAMMAGLDWHMPMHPPLVLDGMLAINMPLERLPLAPDMLDFRGPWSAWTGA